MCLILGLKYSTLDIFFSIFLFRLLHTLIIDIRPSRFEPSIRITCIFASFLPSSFELHPTYTALLKDIKDNCKLFATSVCTMNNVYRQKEP